MDVAWITMAINETKSRNDVITDIRDNSPISEDAEMIEKCSGWLEKCDLNDENVSSNSSTYVSFDDICGEQSDIIATRSSNDHNPNEGNVFDGNKEIEHLVTSALNKRDLDTALPSAKSGFQPQSVLIESSSQVHLGNMTVINGPVYLQEVNSTTNTQQGKASQHMLCTASVHSADNDGNSDNDNSNITEIKVLSRSFWKSNPLNVLGRRIKSPVKFVIICHTKTAECDTIEENALLCNHIQQREAFLFGCDDLMYNFLIGGDGHIFEGRGWGEIPSLARRYDKLSLGIAFIGHFNAKLPHRLALKQAIALIKYGVEQKYIDPKYKLLGHCQVTDMDSPGDLLFEEIKKWDNANPSITITRPSPLVL